MGRVRLLLYVDIGGPLSGHPEAIALRDGPDSVALSVLGHFHLVNIDAGLLSASATGFHRLRQAVL